MTAIQMSLYALKPRFQAVLRPCVQQLHRWGVTANQVTLLACAVSVALGFGLHLAGSPPQAFALIPVWMALRMAFNAADGMLAREHGQQTRLGAMLNELCDVVSDAALYLPFAGLAPFDAFWVGVVIVLAILSEFAGALGPTIGAARRYDGPMGKSDRALVFGAIGLAAAFGFLPQFLRWTMPVLAALILLTTLRRVQRAIAEPSP